jgi:flagellar biosynthesis/type III secretory pathway chaperone
MIPCLHSDKEALQEAMGREVTLMRNLLTSLHDECNAIRMHNSTMFDDVMDERICLFSSFEQWSEKLIEITIKLARDAEVIIRRPRFLRHSEAIDILQECLNPDDFELLSLREQILALIDEIHHQNDINASLIRDGVPSECFYEMIPETQVMPKLKSVVAVIDK